MFIVVLNYVAARITRVFMTGTATADNSICRDAYSNAYSNAYATFPYQVENLVRAPSLWRLGTPED
ncbi:MAG: hypothetical protein QNL99_07505 [SAR86 cluster bacterium]